MSSRTVRTIWILGVATIVLTVGSVLAVRMYSVRSDTARIQQARLALKANKPDLAARYTDDILARRPDYVPALCVSAQRCVYTGDSDKAMAQLSRALSIDADNIEVHRGWIEYCTHRITQLAWSVSVVSTDDSAAWNQAVQDVCRQAATHVQWFRDNDMQIEYHIAAGRVDLAVALLRQCASRSDSVSETPLYPADRTADSAVDHLQQALQLGRDHMGVRRYLARALYFTRSYTQCLEHLQTLVDADAAGADDWTVLGAVHIAQGRMTAARWAFKQAARHMSRSSEGIIALLAAAMEHNMAQACRPLVVAWYRQHQSDPQALAVLIECEIASGNGAVARELVARLDNTSPPSLQNRFAVARGYLRTGCTTQALQCARALVDDYGDLRGTHLLLAECYLAARRYTSAMRVLDAASARPVHAADTSCTPSTVRFHERNRSTVKRLHRVERIGPHADFDLLAARVYVEQGDLSAARDRLQSCLDTHDNVAARLLLADVWARLARPDQACEQLVKVINTQPANVAAWQALVYLADTSGTAGVCPSESQAQAQGKALDRVRLCRAPLSGAFRVAGARGSDCSVPSPRAVPPYSKAVTPPGTNGTADDTTQSARLALQRLLDRYADHIPPALVQPVAEALLLLDKPRQAEELCRSALDDGINWPGVYVQMVRAQTRLHHIQPAADTLDAAIRCHRDMPELYMMLAELYLTHDQVDTGVAHLDSLQRVHPTWVCLARGWLLRHAGRPQEALRQVQKRFDYLLEKRDPGVLVIAEELAANLRALDQHEQALEVYRRCVGSDILPYASGLALAEEYYRQNDVAKALQQIERITPADDESYRMVHQQIIGTLVGWGRPDMAARRCRIYAQATHSQTPDRKALPRTVSSVSGMTADERRQYAELLTMAGRFDTARGLWIDAWQRHQDDRTARHGAIATCLMQADYPHAVDMFRQWSNMGGIEHLSAQLGMAQLFMQLGLYDQARRAMVDMPGLDDAQDPRILYTAGRALYVLGDFDASVALLERIPSAAPQHARAIALQAIQTHVRGRHEQSRLLISQVAAAQQTAADALAELLGHMREGYDLADLCRFADPKLSFDALPAHMQIAWTDLMLRLADQPGQVDRIQASLDRICERDAAMPRHHAARLVCTLARRRDAHLSEQFRAAGTRLGGYAPLLAAVLDLPQPDDTHIPRKNAGYDAWIELAMHLARGDRQPTTALLDRVTSHGAFFADDLRTCVDQHYVPNEMTRTSWRLTLGAMIARQCGLPGIAAELADRAAQMDSSNSLALACRVQASQEYDVRNPAVRLDYDRTAHAAQRAHARSLEQYLRALQAIENGDVKDAVTLLATLVRDRDAGLDIQLRAGTLAAAVDMPEQARQLLEPLAAGDTAYRVPATNELALLTARHDSHHIDNALARVDEVLRQRPNDPYLLDTAGWLAYQSGDVGRALQLLNTAVVKLNHRPEIHYHLGLAYVHADNLKWAKYHLQAAADADSQVREVFLARRRLEQITQPNAISAISP